MAFQAITTAVLTNPFQVLLMGMILFHGVRAAVLVARGTGRAVAGRSDLRAA